ncbi:MAG TPA: DUF1579 domain-containing protein [Thermoanaerobaculia bacterium]|nr:DUF1579 domain-containing protein [Thermoanaerobaculia bacterium]
MKQIVSAIALCALFGCTAAAQDAASPATHPPMTAEEQAGMEAWMKASTPGDPHEALAPMIGNWDVVVRMWHTPDSPMIEEKGTVENRWILGGRWVEQKFSASVMGQPFEGLGHVGYDNMKGTYVATWKDTMSTGVMTSKGKADADGKAFRFSGLMADPISGKDLPIDDEMRVVTPDRLEATMWTTGPDGKRFKSMEFIYTRRR